MARTLIALTLLIGVSFSNSLAQPSQQAKLTKAEEEVRKLERLWLDAYEQKDSQAMNRIEVAHAGAV